MESVQFILNRVEHMKKETNKLNGQIPRTVLMEIGRTAEEVAAEIEYFLKWGSRGDTG
jgi:hypothetical protein